MTKKLRILLSFLFLFHVFTGKSQSEYYNQNWAFDVYLMDQYPYEIKGNGEFSEAVFQITNNGKKSTVIKKFDSKGNMTAYYFGKSTDSIEKKGVFTYDTNNQLKSASLYKKHQLKFQYSYSFDDKNHITNLRKNDVEGNVIINRDWNYNSDGFVEEATVSHKNSLDIHIKWKYEYYDKGKLKHTYYYKKGKLKKEWDYMCKEEGEEVTAKNLNKVCIFKETKNDTLTSIYQHTNGKGKITKTIYTFTAKDTLPLAIIEYNSDNKLVSKRTYDKSYEKLLSYTWHKKGKPKYETSNVYVNDRIISSQSKTNGKNSSRKEFAYNESGQITEFRKYDKKDHLKVEYKISYRK